MLKSITAETAEMRVFRMAQIADDGFLRRQGLDRMHIDDMNTLLKSRGIADNMQDLCDSPFRRKPQLRRRGHRTRFSDGSFPVFYSAIEAATAKAERLHWFRRDIGKSSGSRTAYFRLFSCCFEGKYKDLRPKIDEWPELVDEDYEFCNALGAEAVATGLKGLLTPSARRAGGTNMPVFARDAISDPDEGVVVSATYDSSTEELSVRRA